MVTPEQIELVQKSWEQVVPIQQQAAALFYARLFQIAPEVRPLFTTDMVAQGRKLMTMIGLVVSGLSRLDQLLPMIRDLGRRHRQYGVTAAHYDVVSAALMWTLQKGLGDSFTEHTRDAWITAYRALASTMKRAAAEMGSTSDSSARISS